MVAETRTLSTVKTTKAITCIIGVVILALTESGCLRNLVRTTDMAGAIHLERNIFSPDMYGKECHSSTVIELSNGDLYAAWWCGTTEGSADVAIFGARLPAGAPFWQQASIIADTEGSFDGNPVLFTTRDESLHLFFVKSAQETGRVQIMTRESTDFGHSWGPISAFASKAGIRPRNHLIVLKNGEVLFPLHNDELAQSTFLISDNGGKSWLPGGAVPSGVENAQPTVISRKDGSVYALMRSWDSDPAKRYLLQSESRDFGRTWSQATYSNIPSVSSSSEMIKLMNGHVVLAFNEGKERERTPLTLALSLDEGRTWPYKRKLESGKGSFSYPSLVQTLDGRIHITYSYNRLFIKHVEINEAWIKALAK